MSGARRLILRLSRDVGHARARGDQRKDKLVGKQVHSHHSSLIVVGAELCWWPLGTLIVAGEHVYIFPRSRVSECTAGMDPIGHMHTGK
jgi:hypothetical protein